MDDKAGGAQERSGLDWAARVQRLEAEVDGLRRAMRSRAVIEQAKGFLSAALNCGLDEAFGHLARLSQHENLRVAEVAARIIGSGVPGTAEEPDQPTPVDARLFDPLTYLHGGPIGTEDEEPPESVDLPVLPAETRVRLQAAAAAVQSAATLTELADRLLDEGTGWLGAEAVMIWTSEPDGALRLATCAGLAPQVASDWQRIPSRVRAPVRDAISKDEPVWLDGRRRYDYTIMREGSAAASLPLRYGGRPFAGLVVLWEGHHTYPDTERRYLTGLAALAGRRFRKLARSADVGTPPGHWLQGMLDALPVATLLLAPLRDQGTIIDFVIDYASPLAGEPEQQVPPQLTGRRLLDVRPQLANTGVFEAYRQVALAGGTWRRSAQAETVLVDGTPEQRIISRSAVRLGEGLLVSWRIHDAEAQLTRVGRVEDLASVGYLEWDLLSDSLYWSPGTYKIFDRSPQRGPVTLDHLPEHVVPEDLPALQSNLRQVLEEHEPAELVLRLRVGGGERLVRAVFRPVPDEHGDLVGLYGVVQDLSELQRRSEAQRRSEHAAKIRRVHGAVSPRRDW
ncbi:MAG: ANTAR domain-containing protein [Actinobacteria bacterium]|nr:MAG: ANTAR domain-containing protein [Actinomycetota bacterium]